MNSQPISVYGYDQRMLSKMGLSAPPKWQPVLPLKPVFDLFNHTPGRCYLLELPPEIRKNVWHHLLPRTYTHYKGIVWYRANISILSTSKVIYQETIQEIYSHNTFLIDVVWDCSTFANQWILSSRLVPKRAIAFPEGIALRNIPLLRKFHIRIRHVDSYTGMVKYNYSGPGLTAGLQDQVKFLCQTLRSIPEIWSLHIDLQDDNVGGGKVTTGIDAILLEPFASLKNTRTVTLSGSISPIYSQSFKHRLTNAYQKNCLLRLPPEIRSQIYTYVLSSQSYLFHTRAVRRPAILGGTTRSQTKSSHHSLHSFSFLSILYTSHFIHTECVRTFYSTHTFMLSVRYTLLWLAPVWSCESIRGIPEERFFRDSGFRYLRYVRKLVIEVPSSWDDGEVRAVHGRVLGRLGEVLGSNTGIESIKLKSGFEGVAEWMQNDLRGLIVPLLEYGKLKRFEVEGLWGEGECEWLRRKISGEQLEEEEEEEEDND